MSDIDWFGNDPPQYKRIDGPWIGLLVLAAVIFLASLIAIPLLYLCWRRYQQATRVEDKSEILENQSASQRQIPIHVEDPPRDFYEAQVNIVHTISKNSFSLSIANRSICSISRQHSTCPSIL